MRLRLIILIVSYLGLADMATSACDCITQPPVTALQSADLVFHGTVVHTTALDDSSLSASLTVEAVWKGPVQLNIELVTPDAAEDCGVEFTEGSEYLVFATLEGDVLAADSCRVAPYPTEMTAELGAARWTRDIFRRGDPNADGRHDLSDVIFTLQYMFGNGATPGCQKSADANSDAKVDIGDALYMLQAYFYGLATIAAPHPYCGATTVADGLTCATYAVCDGPSPSRDIWLSRSEIMALPTSGEAWDRLLDAADSTPPAPRLRDQDSATDVLTLAKALVYARTKVPRYRTEVIDLCMQAIGTEDGGRTLALGRGLVGYVIAADLVGLDPREEKLFSTWLRRVLTKDLDERTLQSTHEDRPNNWGTHAGASRAAVALYLGDHAELQRTALVFKGFLGDRSSYAAFKYGALDWQSNPDRPVGINPKGATRDGYDVDGVIPDDMRRGGTLRFPPERTVYAWESLQGIVVQAEILFRAGFDTWNWEEQAIRRAVEFLYRIGWEAGGDDTWQIPLLNLRYGTVFPLTEAVRSGKNMGWTDWTHGSVSSN